MKSTAEMLREYADGAFHDAAFVENWERVSPQQVLVSSYEFNGPALISAATAIRVRLIMLSYNDDFINDYESLMYCTRSCFTHYSEESEAYLKMVVSAFNVTWQVTTYRVEMGAYGPSYVLLNVNVDDDHFPRICMPVTKTTLEYAWEKYTLGNRNYAIIDLSSPEKTLVDQVKRFKKKRSRGKKVYGYTTFDQKDVNIAKANPKTRLDFDKLLAKNKPEIAEECHRLVNGEYRRPPRGIDPGANEVWRDEKKILKRRYLKLVELAKPLHGPVFGPGGWPKEPPSERLQLKFPW